MEFIIRRYGAMRSKDIARILGWNSREVNAVLRELESWGKVRRTKFGRTLAWTHVEDHSHNLMFY